MLKKHFGGEEELMWNITTACTNYFPCTSNLEILGSRFLYWLSKDFAEGFVCLFCKVLSYGFSPTGPSRLQVLKPPPAVQWQIWARRELAEIFGQLRS